MPTKIDVGNVPFNEAIDFFKAKLNLPSRSWNDLSAEVHARAFSVAGATKQSLIDDLRIATEKAVTDGVSIGQFRKDFDVLVAKHGWDFKGERNWRTRVIYDTNLRTAHMAGRWQQIQRLKDKRPFLQYMTVGDNRVRPEHATWNKTVLSVDDDWWDSHYPPNGWGCRCTVRSLSARDMRREKLDVGQAPTIQREDRINPRTGEVFPNVPAGIDPGWDHNVGKAWLGPDQALGEHIMRMPDDLRSQALNEAQKLVPHLAKEFSPWVTSLMTRKTALGEIKTVGYISESVVSELAKRSQVPTSALITATDKDIMHMLRDAKDGKHLPMDMVRVLPSSIDTAKAVLLDKRDNALLYVFDPPGDDRQGKVVIRVNYKIKARGGDGRRHAVMTNSLRSGGLVDLISLTQKGFYEVLKGEL